MLKTLDEFSVEGIFTTIPFLQKVLRNLDFAEGKVNMRIIEQIIERRVGDSLDES